MVEAVELGRDAMDRHAWAEAMDGFAAADRDGGLAAADLELLGTAAWWAGQPDEATEALERAFAAYVEAGQSREAARVAMALAYRRSAARPVGRRRLAGPGGAPARIGARVAVARPAGRLPGARGADGGPHHGGDRARRPGDGARPKTQRPQIQLHGDELQGHGPGPRGDWQAGLALIDEAAAAASSGQLDLRVASDIYCNTIAACRNVGDLKRAAQWADEGERWMRRQAVGGYPGICRVHRAELKMLRGQWSEAEQEARQACEELERFGLLDGVGYAQYEVGEVRLRMGDLDGAAEAFERAYEYGHDAQPGIALLQLARGEVDEAGAVDRSRARRDGRRRWRRRPSDAGTPAARPRSTSRWRPATWRPPARPSIELESIAADFQRPVFEAGALTARGELLLGEDRPSEASPILGRSWRLWQETDLPYESARARLHYAEAMAAEGDQAAARRDLRAARGVFERLGAKLDLARVDALLGEGAEPSARAPSG